MATAKEVTGPPNAKSRVRNAYAVLRLPAETGDATQIEDETEDELRDQENRLIYVKNVRHKTKEAIAKYEMVKLKSRKKLFQYGMILGLEGNETDGFKPKILSSVPSELEACDFFVCNFCFPDADTDACLPQTEYEGDLFSFVLTSETGDRRFGWCRRYLPPGSGARLLEAICIVSPIGEFGMYEQLLRYIQDIRSISLEYAIDVIKVAYARSMPEPNKEVRILTEIEDRGRCSITLKRGSNSGPDTRVPFSRLLDYLPVPVLLQVFGSILLERKILFCAKYLNVLSTCISALVALLYPFEWQHTYITVLPSSLIDIVDAPTPFIVGILSSMKSFLEDHDLSEVLIVDLDEGSVANGLGYESRILPKKLQKALTTALTDNSDVQNASAGMLSKSRGVSSETISEAFQRFFVETCAHYSDFIVRPEDDETKFQREAFVKAVHSTSIRLFLDWFTQTQMFEVFMSGKLNQNATLSGHFDQLIADYRKEMETDIKTHKNSLKQQIKKLFHDSSCKLKKTFRKVYV